MSHGPIIRSQTTYNLGLLLPPLKTIVQARAGRQGTTKNQVQSQPQPHMANPSPRNFITWNKGSSLTTPIALA